MFDTHRRIGAALEVAPGSIYRTYRAPSPDDEEEPEPLTVDVARSEHGSEVPAVPGRDLQ